MREPGSRARLRSMFFGAVVTLTDLLPPRIRYGYIHRITRAAFSSPLPAVRSAVCRPPAADNRRVARSADLACGILADHLDIGGIGAVIEMLAGGLMSEGVRPVVVCAGDGARAARLRGQGVEVISVADRSSADAALSRSGADVFQLHSAPRYLEHAAMATALPLVTVMHNTEIHYTRSKWESYRALLARSAAGVAVSETVREYHARRLSPPFASRITVVPNGAPALSPATEADRTTARSAVEAALGVDLRGGVLFVCLARYDSQKNIAGATVAFTRAARRHDDIHLVFAGDPSDWAELRRAEALRDLGAPADRIHFLGNSDAVTLLTASDAFLLDSFFEGWPVAATEAAAAGLPLVISEMGGAVELVSRDPEYSVMTPNPAGDAAGVSDSLVRRARRRTRRQFGTDDLESAILAVAERVRRSPGPLVPRASSGVSEMVAAHAAVLRDAASH